VRNDRELDSVSVMDDHLEAARGAGWSNTAAFHMASILDWTRPLRELEKLVWLRDGFAAVSGVPPNADAIRKSLAFLRFCGSVGIYVRRLEPSVVGGVGITFDNGKDPRAYMEFRNSGSIIGCNSGPGDEPTVYRIRGGEEPTKGPQT